MRAKSNINYFSLSMQKASFERWTLNHVHISHASSYNMEGIMFIEQQRISIEGIDGLSKMWLFFEIL